MGSNLKYLFKKLDLRTGTPQFISTIVFGILIFFILIVAIAPTPEETNTKKVDLENNSNTYSIASVTETQTEEVTGEEIKEIVEPTPSIIKENGSIKYNTELLQDKELYKITEVISGDTVTAFANGESFNIRLLEITASEKNECFAVESTNRLKELVSNVKLYLIKDSIGEDKNADDRLLRYIVLNDGTIVNYELLRNGYGNEYTYKTKTAFAEEFNDAQEYAQVNNLGIWGDACKCQDSAGETTMNECTGCNQRTIKTRNFDCTKSKEIIEDTDCSSLCPKPEPVQFYNAPTYTCNCSKTCPNMGCAEAQFQLNSCGCYQRDADNDGVACDSQCQ